MVIQTMKAVQATQAGKAAKAFRTMKAVKVVLFMSLGRKIYAQKVLLGRFAQGLPSCGVTAPLVARALPPAPPCSRLRSSSTVASGVTGLPFLGSLFMGGPRLFGPAKLRRVASFPFTHHPQPLRTLACVLAQPAPRCVILSIFAGVTCVAAQKHLRPNLADGFGPRRG